MSAVVGTARSRENRDEFQLQKKVLAHVDPCIPGRQPHAGGLSQLGIPWRACEEMHWAMGKHEIAYRADEVPFAITTAKAGPREQKGAAQHTLGVQNEGAKPLPGVATLDMGIAAFKIEKRNKEGLRMNNIGAKPIR